MGPLPLAASSRLEDIVPQPRLKGPLDLSSQYPSVPEQPGSDCAEVDQLTLEGQPQARHGP
eukprot:6347384-Amphidinium_carterae.2